MDSPFFFESTTYWSEGDEKAHFDWLDGIPCIREARGQGIRLFLSIDQEAVTQQDLRELNAVYRRYGGDLRQLKALEKFVNAAA